MPTRRSTPRTPRQEEIVDAAIDLVREGGWPHLTVRRLAKRLGVTDPALYRHFAGKGEVALAIADRMQALLLGPVRAIAAEPATAPRRKIERIVTHHVELLLATDGLPMLLMAEAATGDERLAAKLRQVMGEYMATLAGLVAALPRRASTAPPAEVVLQLLGLPAVVALQRRLMPGRSLSDAQVRRTLARHLRQVLPAQPGRRKEESR
ncbi:MAG: hypothetical protein AMXMBFR36_04910 [Acidobacteriota bacterium]